MCACVCIVCFSCVCRGEVWVHPPPKCLSFLSFPHLGLAKLGLSMNLKLILLTRLLGDHPWIFLSLPRTKVTKTRYLHPDFIQMLRIKIQKAHNWWNYLLNPQWMYLLSMSKLLICLSVRQYSHILSLKYQHPSVLKNRHRILFTHVSTQLSTELCWTNVWWVWLACHCHSQ